MALMIAFTITRKLVMPFMSFKVFITRRDFKPFINFIDLKTQNTWNTAKNGRDPIVEIKTLNKL